MTCADCGREDCDGSCQSNATLPRPPSQETASEEALRKRMERGDTWPDIEDEDAEDGDEDELADSDRDDSDQSSGRG
jgi:hypothetical protein